MTTLRDWFSQFHKVTGEDPTMIRFSADAGYGERDHDGNDKWEEYGLVRGRTIYFDTIPDSALDRQFSSDYGGEEAPAFYAWSPNWVLCKGTYDGAEWCEWVPRDPDVIKEPSSVGGG